MSFSAHEMLVFLRARDEASRILNRFGTKLQQLQRTELINSGVSQKVAMAEQQMAYAKTRRQTQAARIALYHARVNEAYARDAIEQAQMQQQAVAHTGLAYTTVGASTAAFGIVTARALSNAADAAIDYRQTAMRTFTQVDKRLKLTSDDIVKFGRETATNFAIPMEQVQESFYDIFSSMELKNGKEAVTMLNEIAEAAVGGATDMNAAGEGMIGIMNSYELAIKDASKVNDVLFALVKEGIGDFSEMSNQMGIAGPSAKRAGQDFRQTAGMIAFLTREGMKVGRVGTFVSRALDAFSNPNTVKNMKKYNVEIYDTHGKMKPVVNIINQMKQAMKGMTQQQKSATLKDMFAGSGGTIQAMRFFNAAITDTDGSLEMLTQNMFDAQKAIDKNGNVVGEAALAYQKMANTDASRLLIAQNKIAVGIQKIGDTIAPIKTAIVEFFAGIMDGWNKLNPEVQRAIVITLAVVAGFAILSGVILTVIGVVMMFQGIMAATTLTLGAVAWPVLAVVAAVAALAGIGYLLVTNWEAIQAFFKPFVDGLVQAWRNFTYIFTESFSKFDGVWKLFSDTLTNAWENVLPYFQQGIDAVTDMWNAWAPSFDRLAVGFGQIGDKVQPFIQALANLAGVVGSVIGGVVVGAFSWLMATAAATWRLLTSIFANMLPGLMAIGAGIVGVIGGIMDLFTGIFTLDWNKFLSGIGQIFGGLVEMVVGILGGLGGLVWGIIKGVVDGIIAFFVYLYDVIVGHSIIPDLVNSIISWIASLPGTVIGFIVNLVTTVISWFIALGSRVVGAVIWLVTAVVGFWTNLPGRILSAISSLASSLGNAGKQWLDNLLKSITTGVSNVINFVKGIPQKILSAIGSVGSLLYNAGSSILEGFLRGLKSMWDNVTGWIRGIGDWIKDNKGPLSYDLKLLEPAGAAIMRGFNKTLWKGWTDTQSLVNKMNTKLEVSSPNISARDVIGTGLSRSNGRPIEITVNTEEIDPVKHAADLGYQLSSELGL